MLIVNADDWGYDITTTDAIMTTFREGRVTSVSAMVFMCDSERAAVLAEHESLPVGLHLNLMEKYSDEGVSGAIKGRQEQVVASFRKSQRARWISGRSLSSLARLAIEDQTSEFGRLYTRPPSHIDGHQHGHLSTPALGVLGRGPKRAVRCSFTFRPGEKPFLNRALRSMLNRYIRARFYSTNRFYSIRSLHPRLGGYGLEDVLATAHELDVEIMVHPGFRDEFDILMSEEWVRLLAGVPLGSFLGLTGKI